MTILHKLEPYVQECPTCNARFKYSDDDIRPSEESHKFGVVLCDYRNGFIICPSCGEILSPSKAKFISTDEDEFGTLMLYIPCLRDAYEEVLGDKITEENLDKINALALEKFFFRRDLINTTK